MCSKAKCFILAATLSVGFQTFSASASSSGQAQYGEWGCITVDAFGWGDTPMFRPGSVFGGTYEQAMQKMKDYLVLLDTHHVWPGDVANAAYTCTLDKSYNS